MTVGKSLTVSCGTIFIRQGISLHYHTQNNTAIYQSLEEKLGNFSIYSVNIEHRSNHIRFLFEFGIILCF